MGENGWSADPLPLYKKMERRIAKCREKYEAEKGDILWSHIRHSELETLEAIYDRIREEGLSEELVDDLKNRLAELKQLKKRERENPSFSWYADHYHYLVLEGECDAYLAVIKLLQGKKRVKE